MGVDEHQIQFLVAFFVLLIGLQVHEISGEQFVVKPPDVANDVKVICDAITYEDRDMKVNIDGMMDYDDLLRLTVWTSKYNLRDGNKLDFIPEVGWKRSILARQAAILLKTCPMEFIDEQFINVAIELFLIYQNSFPNATSHLSMWNPITKILDSCIYSKPGPTKLKMGNSGFDLVNLTLNVDGTTETVDITSPEELADASQDIDVIIDTIFWIFSLTIGQCYDKPENPSYFAARYKRMFYGDFLHPLRSRWLHAGPNTEFGLIFRDLPYKIYIKNIRACVTGIYTAKGIADRQLVRSLTLAAPTMGVDAGLNRKLGKAMNS